MKTTFKKLAIVIALVAAATHLKAQFMGPTYQLTNNLSCDVDVFLEFNNCPTGGPGYYASASYNVQAGTSLTIPSPQLDDAWIVVYAPGIAPTFVGPVCTGSPCMVGMGIFNTASATGACTAGGPINLFCFPSNLIIQP